MPAPMRVAIGIITCKRPAGLGRLLDRLTQLELSAWPDLEVTMAVVDNDTARSAAEVIAGRRDDYRWPLEYYAEPRRGIPFARNEVVRRCADCDLLAFIDDDEEPEPSWLHELLRVQRDYDADVVAGPVLSRFAEPPPPWVIQGGFFDRPRRPTGTPIATAGTGNIVFRRQVLQRVEGPFNEQLATSGGSDAYLLHALHRSGAKMVWADDAVATETVPASRVTVRWLLRRAFRTGTMRGHIEHSQAHSAAQTLRVLARGQGKLASGLAASVVLAPQRHRLVAALRRTFYGAGLIAGVLGHQVQEYRVIHGH